MNVLVIPEDQTLDQYIVKPVIEALFNDLGRSASVSVLPEPRLRGSDDALDVALVGEIIQDNLPMVSLFLLVIDRDCDRKGHVRRVSKLEATHPGVLVGCLAVEEVETWMLALHRSAVESQSGVRWSEIRADCDPKERFAQPLLRSLGSMGPGQGRKAAMRALKGQWKTLCSLCNELLVLRGRVEATLNQGQSPGDSTPPGTLGGGGSP